MASNLAWLTIGLPWLGALLVWRVGDAHPRAQHGLACVFAIAAGIAALALLGLADDSVIWRMSMGGGFGDFTLVADGLGVSLAVIATVIGGLAVIFSVEYMQNAAQLGRYYALVLLFIGAMVGLVLAGSLLLLFLFWEITALCSYALISFYNDDPKAVSGGIRALIMTQLGGIGLLVVALLAYTYLGSYEISAFLTGFHNLPGNVLGLAAFACLIAAAAKSAQVPFHTWLPGAMEAPTPVSALIHAATMVNAGVYLLIRFYPAFSTVPGWTTSVLVVGLLSALLAAMMAAVSTDLKRVLAYSTISQLGYMVLAVGAGDLFASQFHLMSHAVFKALLFLAAGAVIHAVKTRDMLMMGGVGKAMPFVRRVFIIGAFALMGLPITNGFFSKEWMLEAGLSHGPTWAYVGMLIGAGLTAFYTLRMVTLVFYRDSTATAVIHDAARIMKIPLGLLAAGVLTTWILAGPLSELLGNTLPTHHFAHITTGEMAVDIAMAPATLLALAVIAFGLLGWGLRQRLGRLQIWLNPLAVFAANDFGFEWLNRQVVKGVRRSSVIFSLFQTGQLNWNVAGIAGGLVVVLALLIWGN